MDASGPANWSGQGQQQQRHRWVPSPNHIDGVDHLNQHQPHFAAFDAHAAAAPPFSRGIIDSNMNGHQQHQQTWGLTSADAAPYQLNHFHVATAPPPPPRGMIDDEREGQQQLQRQAWGQVSHVIHAIPPPPPGPPPPPPPSLFQRTQVESSSELAQHPTPLSSTQNEQSRLAADKPKSLDIADAHARYEMERKDLSARHYSTISSAPAHDNLLLSGGEQPRYELRKDMRKRKRGDSNDDERSTKRSPGINAINNHVQTVMSSPAAESHADALLPVENDGFGGASAVDAAASTEPGSCTAIKPMSTSTNYSPRGCSDPPSLKLPLADAIGIAAPTEAGKGDAIETMGSSAISRPASALNMPVANHGVECVVGAAEVATQEPMSTSAIGSTATTAVYAKRSRWGPLVACQDAQRENGNTYSQIADTMANTRQTHFQTNNTDHTTSANVESGKYSNHCDKLVNYQQYDKQSNRSESKLHENKQRLVSSSKIHCGGSGSRSRIGYKDKKTAERYVRRLPKKVALWSGRDEGVMKRAKDAIQSMPSETWCHCCPISGCEWNFPTEEILSIHLNSTDSHPHLKHYRRVGALDRADREMRGIFAKEHAKLLTLALAHIGKVPKEPKPDVFGHWKTPIKSLERGSNLNSKQQVIIDSVALWSGGDEGAIKRAIKAVEQIPRWKYSFQCPVCSQKFPTRESCDLHVIGNMTKRHEKYRRNRGRYYQNLLTKAGTSKETGKPYETYSVEGQQSIAMRYLSASKLATQEQNSFAEPSRDAPSKHHQPALPNRSRSQPSGVSHDAHASPSHPLPLPQGTANTAHWTLIIDTCCLVNDKAAGAKRLIKLATQQQNLHNDGQKPSIDMVIPYLVWSELEHQTKAQDGDLAFGARAAIRMLRETLEVNITSPDGNNTNGVLRSQTISESREAAAKFVPEDFLLKTNDDHILACAMLESERAHHKSATSWKTEVVLITQDNNLACKAYSNGLKVNSICEFCKEYRLGSLRQSQEVPTPVSTSCGTTGTALKGKEEVIDLQSDGSDDEIKCPSKNDNCLFVIDREREHVEQEGMHDQKKVVETKA